MPTYSSTRPDPDTVRASATELLTTFRSSPPPDSERLVGDAEMEGQLRGLPDVCFLLGHTRAETSAVGTCVAVGYKSQGRYVTRIYRKTAAGWSSHTYTLSVKVPKARPTKGHAKGGTASANLAPILSWESGVRKAKSTHPARASQRRRTARRH